MADEQRSRFTRKRTFRDYRAPLTLSEWTLEEMASHGLTVVQCQLCFAWLVREEGATRCRETSRCQQRQRAAGWRQTCFGWAA